MDDHDAEDLLRRALIEPESSAAVALRVAGPPALRVAHGGLPRPARPRDDRDVRRQRPPRGGRPRSGPATSCACRATSTSATRRTATQAEPAVRRAGRRAARRADRGRHRARRLARAARGARRRARARRPPDRARRAPARPPAAAAALVAPERRMVVTAVCGARPLAAGRPPMGIVCAQQDVARVYPLPDDPERCLADFLDAAAEHARGMGEQLRRQQTSVERFLELSGEDLPRPARRRLRAGSHRPGAPPAGRGHHGGVRRPASSPRSTSPSSSSRASRCCLRAASAGRGAERARCSRWSGGGARGRRARCCRHPAPAATEPACALVTRERVAAARAPRQGGDPQLRPRPRRPVFVEEQLGTGRVAWRAGDGLPVVQCVRVRRDGDHGGRRGRAARPLRADRRDEASCPGADRDLPPRPVLHPASCRAACLLLLALTALAARARRGGARGRRAVDQGALRGRPERALPGRRRVAVPPGRGGPGRAPGLSARARAAPAGRRSPSRTRGTPATTPSSR